MNERTVEELVRDNLDLTRREARRWRHVRGVEQEDLISEGAVGLVKAARAFDPARGVPFRAYATPRVRGAMIDALRARKNTAGRGGAYYPNMVYIDGPASGTEDAKLELPAPGASVEEQVIARDTLRAVAALPPREAAVVYRTAVLGETLEEAGRALGMTESGAHRLATRGVARLRAGAA